MAIIDNNNDENLGGGALTVTIPGIAGKQIYLKSIGGSVDKTCLVTITDGGGKLIRKFRFKDPGGILDRDFNVFHNVLFADTGQSLIVTISDSTAEAFLQVVVSID